MRRRLHRTGHGGLLNAVDVPLGTLERTAPTVHAPDLPAGSPSRRRFGSDRPGRAGRGAGRSSSDGRDTRDRIRTIFPEDKGPAETKASETAPYLPPGPDLPPYPRGRPPTAAPGPPRAPRTATPRGRSAPDAADGVPRPRKNGPRQLCTRPPADHHGNRGLVITPAVSRPAGSPRGRSAGRGRWCGCARWCPGPAGLCGRIRACGKIGCVQAPLFFPGARIFPGKVKTPARRSRFTTLVRQMGQEQQPAHPQRR